VPQQAPLTTITTLDTEGNPFQVQAEIVPLSQAENFRDLSTLSQWRLNVHCEGLGSLITRTPQLSMWMDKRLEDEGHLVKQEKVARLGFKPRTSHLM
jgi:hypothetical protein